MFEAHLSNSTVLKKLADSMKELLNEASFDCSDSGIEVQAMDSSHVCLISIKLRREGFQIFKCSRNVSLGINLGSFTKILRCASNDDSVTIKAESNADVLNIMFESENKEKVSDYQMRLMNLENEYLGIPDTEYTCKISLPSVEFSRICRDLHQFGEALIINGTKDGVKFSTSGDIGSVNVKLTQGACSDEGEKAVTIEVQEPVTLSFGIRYLMSFTKAATLSPMVKLSLSENFPLMLEYVIADMGHIRYYLAPKIEEGNE